MSELAILSACARRQRIVITLLVAATNQRRPKTSLAQRSSPTPSNDGSTMRIKLSEFDPGAYLDNDEVIAEYLTAALEDGNSDVFLSAVGNVARARGMSAIAESTGLGRESLYKAFAPGAKPRYDTVLKVLQSFGVKLNVSAQARHRVAA